MNLDRLNRQRKTTLSHLREQPDNAAGLLLKLRLYADTVTQLRAIVETMKSTDHDIRMTESLNSLTKLLDVLRFPA